MLSQYLDELGLVLTEVSRCQSFCLFLNLRFFTALCAPVASDAAVMKRQEDITQMSVIDDFFEGQNRNKLFYDTVLSRVIVECNTGNVFFRVGEGHSCFTEIYL